jgi:hypothetical protein
MITVSVTLHLHWSDYRVADLFVMIGASLQQNGHHLGYAEVLTDSFANNQHRIELTSGN